MPTKQGKTQQDHHWPRHRDWPQIRPKLTTGQGTGWPRFGSVRLRFGDGTVRAVPVFGSGGSSKKGVFACFSTVSQRGRFRFRFRFLENGSGSSGSAFGSCENGSDRFLGHPEGRERQNDKWSTFTGPYPKQGGWPSKNFCVNPSLTN